MKSARFGRRWCGGISGGARDGTADPRWETRRYALAKLRGVDLVLEPLPGSSLMAHTMLSFDFGDDGRIVLSIEARKEEGEDYNALHGGLNRFELIYVFLDERDAYAARVHAGHELYAFPADVEPLRLRAFLLALCATTNNLRDQPRFYQIIRDNCTTAWIQHADHLSNRPAGLQLDTVFTGRVARLLHARGGLATDLSYDEACVRFRVDHRVLAALENPEFGAAIRSSLPDPAAP